MNSVLLPNREEEKFDASKCFVTLEQIESLIDKYEDRRVELLTNFDKEKEVRERKNIADSLYYTEGKLGVLKDIRHMAYVNGGYRKE